MGLRFPLQVPPGALILASFISFLVGDGNETSPADLTISIENTSDALGFPGPAHIGTIDHHLRDRPRGSLSIPWDNIPLPAGKQGTPLPSPDISDLLQDLVSAPLWQLGAHVNIIIEASATNSVVGRRDFEGAHARGPELVVFYLPATDATHNTEYSIVVEPVHIRVEPTQESLIAAYQQDTTRLVLQPGYLVGLRFSNIDVPRGGIVFDATLELDAFTGNDEFTSVEIYAEAADDASGFGVSNGSHLIHRDRVSSVVSWPNLRSTTFAIGQPLESPDLASIINDVIFRPGWAIGGHINILINATVGSRTFYHSGAEHGPALHVRFAPPSPPQPDP